MPKRRILLVALLALLSGLAVGYLQGGQLATASDHTAAAVMPSQSADSASLFSPLKSYPAIVAQPLPNAASAGQLSTLAGTSGAMCDAQADSP